MAKKISPTSTKAQILEAYNELLQKLQEKVADNPKELRAREEKSNVVKTAQDNTALEDGNHNQPSDSPWLS